MTHIPHPLCGGDGKKMEAFFATPKDERQTITAYLTHSDNPRWAASHLVRAISNGLTKADRDVADRLRELANHLADQPDRRPPLDNPCEPLMYGVPNSKPEQQSTVVKGQVP
jgi:hypothetical protein